MKKPYNKPEVCSIDFGTGKIAATSASFAERTKRKKKMLIKISDPIAYKEKEEDSCEK